LASGSLYSLAPNGWCGLFRWTLALRLEPPLWSRAACFAPQTAPCDGTSGGAFELPASVVCRWGWGGSESGRSLSQWLGRMAWAPSVRQESVPSDGWRSTGWPKTVGHPAHRSPAFADSRLLARSLARSTARAALCLLSSLRRFLFDLVMVASLHHGPLSPKGRLGVLNVSRFAVLLWLRGNRARRSEGPAPNAAHLVLEYRLRFIRQDRAAYRALVELGSAGHGPEPTFPAPGSFGKHACSRQRKPSPRGPISRA
jgi:hypothetical protein